MSRRRLAGWLLALGVLCSGGAGAWAAARVPQGTAKPPWRLAVLGDSDSQSYQNRLHTNPEPPGGLHAALTLQWTEVLERLAQQQLELGHWDLYGSHHVVARLRRRLGLDARTPQKEDFAYNFAFGGAHCADLNEGLQGQLPHLLALMDKDPEGWQRGIVVIRAGVVDFGYEDSMDLLAQDPQSAAVLGKMDHCVRHMQEVVQQVHARHSTVRFVIVGIFDNRHWPPYLHLWQSEREGRNIAAGLDHFDGALQAWTRSDARLAFFDERALFAQYFGGRDAQGRPAYRSWSPAPDIHIRLGMGDSPDQLVLDNGHNGLAYNILWAQRLLEIVNERFAAGLPGIAPAAALELLAQGLAAHAAR